MASIEFPSHHRSHKNWFFWGGTNRRSPLLSLQLVFTGTVMGSWNSPFLKRHRLVLSTNHHLCFFLTRWKSTFFCCFFVSLVTWASYFLKFFMVCGITLHKHELLLTHYGFEPLRMITIKKIPFWCSSCWKFLLRSLLWRAALCSQQGQTCQGVFLMPWTASM